MSFGRYSREGVSLDVFDDRVGDGWGGITISLDCDDGDSSEVDGKLELTFFLLPQQHLTRQAVANTSIHYEGC